MSVVVLKDNHFSNWMVYLRMLYYFTLLKTNDWKWVIQLFIKPEFKKSNNAQINSKFQTYPGKLLYMNRQVFQLSALHSDSKELIHHFKRTYMLHQIYILSQTMIKLSVDRSFVSWSLFDADIKVVVENQRSRQ